jgi:hypothetical protein
MPDFQPRVGFAWSPASLQGKSVVRGAYTISSYLEGTGTNLRLARNPPFTPTEVTAVYSSPTDQTQNGPGGAVAGNPFEGAVVFVWAPKVQPEMNQEWNLTVQTEASPTTTFQLGYVGDHATHLIVPTPYSQENVTNGQPSPGQYFQGNPTLLSEISTVSGTASTGFQTYHALQAVLQKRISNGLEGQVAYTWSHCMSNNIGYYGSWGDATGAAPGSPYYQNLYDPHADYASCYFDSRNILAAYGTYQLPIGKGQLIGKNMNSVANAVVGGWTASSIVSIHSGFPLAVSQAANNLYNAIGGRGARPDCNPAQMQTFGRSPSVNNGAFQGFQYISPNGYSTPTGAFGNCPLQGPQTGAGYSDTDIGLMKNIHITESKFFQFRGDFLNAFNNVQLGHPNTNFPSATFGLINTSQPARNIQFALKFYY